MIGCPREYFTIELVKSQFISDGTLNLDYPFVEVHWFDRGQEIKDKVAKCITKYVRKMGHENVDVIFIAISGNDYFENGKNF
ncbi:DUF1904 family protein [Haloimpatiens sp. FM7315]|uniref:DUF1904 family protein n=1 Tax=Haloimpatiens sp. FM7315 TaxID=3298609 RepID=UPI003977B252